MTEIVALCAATGMLVVSIAAGVALILYLNGWL